MLRSVFHRLRGLFGLLGLVAVAACGSAGGGDLNHLNDQPIALGTPIHDANAPDHPLVKLCGTYATQCAPSDTNCPTQCPTLHAKGVVVTGVDRYDETADGKSIGNIYVQDPIQTGDRGTPYSGLTLFQTQTIPSDLPLQPGYGVDISGAYQPFPGPSSGVFAVPLPEMTKGSLTLSYEGRDPAPIDVTLDDFSGNGGMAFVGRLVRMKNVSITSTFSVPRHEAAINSSTTLVMASQFFPLDDPKGFGAANGKTYSSVVGVLNFFYTYKLCPRSPDDFTP